MDTQGLAQYAGQAYKATAGLMKLVPDDKLGWRPAETGNWMTTGQLLEHLATSTGVGANSFVKDEWPDLPMEEMLPTLDKMAAVSTVEEALKKLEADRALTQKCLAELSEEDFSKKMAAAPWNPTTLPLWRQLLLMVEHQINHKAMLFAYLKLMGVEVNTGHLYGMG